MRILGDKLKQIRKARGMSQAELAKGICTQATISLIEKKNRCQAQRFSWKFVSGLKLRWTQ